LNLLLTILRKIVAQCRSRRLGLRSPREIHFAKYQIAPQGEDRFIEERLLRSLPKLFGPRSPRHRTTR
jgi:hypothetical protein